ncbi:MAG TPA: cupin domain-containing protein [Streptosporangiaceae bacterium]|nr:cupin domain-containing protein [Streptosporangiaceae bacterium]
MQVIGGAGKFSQPKVPFDTHWTEHFRVPALSVGTYSIPVGGTDDQDPHTEDEIYVITAGRSGFVASGRRVEVGPGSVIYVAAGEVHKFVDIAEDLAVLVLFAPAEGSASVPRLTAFAMEHIAVFNAAVTRRDFGPLLARFTNDALVRFENVPVAGVLEFSGRDALTAAYGTNPPDDEIELVGDPAEDDGTVVADFVWKRDRSPGVMKLTVTDDNLISRMLVTFS